MKMLKIFLLLFISSSFVFAQTDPKNLDGEWLVIKVIKLDDGTLSRGKHTDEQGYLKFRFDKKKLFLTTSPLDIGMAQPIKYTSDGKIKLLFDFNIPANIPEVSYTISHLSDDSLKLQSNNANNDIIEYTLTRLKENPSSIILSYKPILINPIEYEDARRNSVFTYNFSNKDGRYQGPVYLSNPTIGTSLSSAIEFPDKFAVGKTSNELIVKLKISKKGKVERMDLLKRLDPSIDISVLEFFEKSKWVPLIRNGEPVDSEIILSFKFLLEKTRFMRNN